MKKYKVLCNATEYMQAVEIEARDEDEAGDIYAKMLENGEVLGIDYEYGEIQVEELQ